MLCKSLSASILAAAAASLMAAAVDVNTLGPRVGDKVPDFTLVDQTGQTRTLASILGPNGAILVFFRSADW